MAKIYIAGPMRGYENFNFDAFDKAEARLKDEGWNPISPASMDRLYEGWWPYPPDGLEITLELRKRVISRDLDAILQCDAIYLLKGWEKSAGVMVELALAQFLGLPVLYEDDTCV